MAKKIPTKKKTKVTAKKTKVKTVVTKKKAKKAKPRKKSSRATTAPSHAGATPGAIVAGTDPCVCGDSPEEHGRDSAYPGSTSCRVCATCIAYEANPAPSTDEGWNEGAGGGEGKPSGDAVGD